MHFVVLQSCSTLCDPMKCSTPGFLILHYLLEFAQTQVHWAGDAIQPSHPLSPLSSSIHQSFPVSGSFPMSQLFESGGQSTGALASASVLPINIQDWFPLGLTGRGEREKEARHTESCRMTLQPWISHRHSGLQQTLVLRGRGGLGRTGWLGAGPGGAGGHSVNMGVGLDLQDCSPG